MRLIDADQMALDESEAYMAAQVQIQDNVLRGINEIVHRKIQMLLADTPAVDAVPVVHGRKTAADIRSGEETSTFAEDDVICPWCGYRYGSDELGYADWPEFFEDGEHGMFCDECGKPFTLTVNVRYSYDTERAEDEDE